MPGLSDIYGETIIHYKFTKPTCHGEFDKRKRGLNMRLSYNNNSMIPEDVDTKNLHFEKVDETHVGLPVLGLFENPKSKYGASYSIISVREGQYIGINIPSWLGSEIKADFEESSQSVSDFFNTVIESVTEIPTDKGNPTKGVTFGYAK